MIQTGIKAPDFVLEDQNGEKISLNQFRDKSVLLSFHPLAWTSVCSEQMKALESSFEIFEKFNVMPLGINVDPVPSKKAWAENLGLKKLKILSDFWPHGKTAENYGIFRTENGFSERANIIISPEREIILTKLYKIPELPELSEIIGFISRER
ncbi:redoxin domain-containing protein [candidate division WOR-3 bacterium]|nr:redoxin domain-containing protein [candidate division WOR-3 bacterium]